MKFPYTLVRRDKLAAVRKRLEAHERFHNLWTEIVKRTLTRKEELVISYELLCEIHGRVLVYKWDDALNPWGDE